MKAWKKTTITRLINALQKTVKGCGEFCFFQENMSHECYCQEEAQNIVRQLEKLLK